ncbi:MAG: hypothetical protein ACOH1K_05885 [Rhodoglobus sp.]
MSVRSAFDCPVTFARVASWLMVAAVATVMISTGIVGMLVKAQ